MNETWAFFIIVGLTLTNLVTSALNPSYELPQHTETDDYILETPAPCTGLDVGNPYRRCYVR